MPAGRRTLELSFPDADALREEFARNLSRGGLVVPAGELYEPRELVRVRISLPFCGESLELEAEVVGRIEGREGRRAVALQLLADAPELRERLLNLLAPTPGASAPALLDATGDGDLRVRDLSATGALVCSGGPVVPVGELVRLKLAPPGDGDPFEVKGQVVHHFETGGGTTAMGIQFELEPGQRERLERYAEAVQAADQVRRMGAITGPVEQVGLANLLQMLGSCAKIGTLVLTTGAREGRVAFEDRCLRHARVGCVTGPKALARMLAWGEGTFEFHASVEPGEPEESPPLSLDGALFEAVRQIDELERVDRRALPAPATLVVDARRLDAERSGLDKTQEAVADLAMVGARVQRIVDVVPLPDYEVYEALNGLAHLGIVSLSPTP